MKRRKATNGCGEAEGQTGNSIQKVYEGQSAHDCDTFQNAEVLDVNTCELLNTK